MVFSDEYGSWCTVNAVDLSNKYLGIGDRDLYTISNCNNMQPQLCKQLQCKLKWKTIQQVVTLLFCKILVFEFASISGNLIVKLFLAMFGVV